MKNTNFTTSIEDLKLILDDTKGLNFSLKVENRPVYRDVVVEVTAEEQTLFDFIDRNSLSKCIGKVCDA